MGRQLLANDFLKGLDVSELLLFNSFIITKYHTFVQKSTHLYKSIDICTKVDYSVINRSFLMFTYSNDELQKIKYKELKNKIKINLTSLGFDFGLLGSHYIQEIVLYLSFNHKKIHSLSSGVFKEIAAVHNNSVKCVDKDIRWAIHKAYTCGILGQISTFASGKVPTIKQTINWLFDFFICDVVID